MRWGSRCITGRLASGILLLWLCGTAGWAAPNGYTLIPIAKVFTNGVAAFSVTTSRLGGSSTLYTTQYGLLNRFEAGLDYQTVPTDQRELLGNAKYLLVHEPGRLPDIACGIQNIGAHQQASPYFVATTQPAAFGFSAGVIRPSGSKVVSMGGIAYNASPSLQFVADYIGGSAGYHTFGVIAAATKTISINAAIADPNRGGISGGRGFVLNIAYTFHTTRDRSAGSGTKKSAPNNSSPGAGNTGNKGGG